MGRGKVGHLKDSGDSPSFKRLQVGNELEGKEVKIMESGVHATLYYTTDKKLYAMGNRIQSHLNIAEQDRAVEVTPFDHERYEILKIAGNQGRKPYANFHLICFDKTRNKKVLMSAGRNEYGTLGQGSGDNKYRQA